MCQKKNDSRGKAHPSLLPPGITVLAVRQPAATADAPLFLFQRNEGDDQQTAHTVHSLAHQSEFAPLFYCRVVGEQGARPRKRSEFQVVPDGVHWQSLANQEITAR